jgi:hypothetical protein
VWLDKRGIAHFSDRRRVYHSCFCRRLPNPTIAKERHIICRFSTGIFEPPIAVRWHALRVAFARDRKPCEFFSERLHQRLSWLVSTQTCTWLFSAESERTQVSADISVRRNTHTSTTRKRENDGSLFSVTREESRALNALQPIMARRSTMRVMVRFRVLAKKPTTREKIPEPGAD